MSERKGNNMISKQDRRGQFNVTGIDPRLIIQTAFMGSRPQGLGFLHHQPGGLTDEELASVIERVGALHDKLATCHPKLSRDRVWCTACGATRVVNTPGALRNGWPKCCGYTMTIDSPEERGALQENRHD